MKILKIIIGVIIALHIIPFISFVFWWGANPERPNYDTWQSAIISGYEFDLFLLVVIGLGTLAFYLIFLED